MLLLSFAPRLSESRIIMLMCIYNASRYTLSGMAFDHFFAK
ncbi:hypothetical protein KKH3_24750 [Pectobacterium actinidiae]|nr:hypothetical protein KKH3_24750 [Pectobacterium actinidiae]